MFESSTVARRLVVPVAVAVLSAVGGIGTLDHISAQTASCRFVLGFNDLRESVGADRVGECREDEQHDGDNGDGRQRTTGGEMVWRRASNTMAFTNGYETWVAGPEGLQRRLNAERFAWEPDAASFPRAGDASPVASAPATRPSGLSATPAASPAAVRTPTTVVPGAASPLGPGAVASPGLAPRPPATATPTTAGAQPAGTAATSAAQPTGTPAPAATRSATGFNAADYIGRGNEFDCTDFASQAEAQAVLRADPDDPNRLDGRDENGIACGDDMPGPFDRVPVKR